MGEVFRAHDRLTRQDVALKRLFLKAEKTALTTQMLSTEAEDDPSLTIAREFHVLASLRHRHIIDVRDYGFDREGHAFFTMGLLEHPRTLIQAGSRQPLAEQIRLFGEVLGALTYLHRRGILHRDLKPDNVLVTREGTVKVLDFGLAVEAGQATEIQGTITYAAPEILHGEAPSEQSDLYAVGLMAYELISGSYPFELGELKQLVRQITEQALDFTRLESTMLWRNVPRENAKALTSVIQRLMHLDPTRRTPTATEALTALYQALDLAPPMESAEVRESFLQAAHFVGRNDQLRQLKDALTTAHTGKGSGWLVGGESGVGKSRLVSELRTRALVNGHLVLTGQAVEVGGLPYQLWRDVLPRLVLELELSDLEAGILKPAVPNIEQLLGRIVPEVPDLSGAAGRQRFAFTIISLIRRLAQPALLILEDLHWHDDLDTLADLVRHLPAMPLLIVGTYRDDERADLPAALPGMQVLHLSRLTEDETTQLSNSMLGATGERPEVIDVLRRETEGNAFFLVEVLRALAEESGGLAYVGQRTLPSGVFAAGVQRLIDRRLSRVPEWGQKLLRTAALMGRQVDLAALRHAIALDPMLLPVRTLDDWVGAASGAAVLELSAERWKFAHDKLREHLTQTIDSEALLTMHRLVALALEAAHPGDAAYDEVLLFHWREAGDTERELHYLIRVVQTMVDLRATYRQAENLIVRGLSLLPQEDARRATLLNWRSVLWWAQADYEVAEAQARMALALAERLGARPEVARGLVNLGTALRERADYAAAETCFHQGLALYRDLDDKQGVARSLNHLGIVADMRGEYAVAESHYNESLALSRETHHAAGIARALTNLGVLARLRGDYAGAEVYYQEGLALYRDIGHTQGRARVLNNLGNVAADRGDYNAAKTYYQESLATSHEINDSWGIEMVLNNLGEVFIELREYTDAEDHFRQSLSLAREIGDTQGIALILNNLGIVARSHGEHGAAEAYFQESLTASRDIGDARGTCISLTKLAQLAFEQRQPALLRYLCDGLATSLNTGTLPITLDLLITAAARALQEGQIDEVARVAGLVEANPATLQDVREERLSKLIDDLRAVLPADDLALRLAEGAALDVEATIRAWLARLERELVEQGARDPGGSAP
ncbi:MAG: tetratricopeptide repeat protein [Chloroflexi bacterium]|nr:tetratricopeptide repeat protein [Chloroflexota bacterium]